MELKNLGRDAADYSRRSRDFCVGVLAVVEEKGRVMIYWLTTPFGRWAAIAAMAALAWASAAVHYETKGANRAVAKIETRNEANVHKANSARRSADTLPAERLRDGYFRD